MQVCQPCSSVPVMQVEFILMGGTFMSLPAEYRDYFVRGLHDALSGHASASCAEAVSLSEHSRTKCIGLTIETRPDFCLTPHLTQARCARAQRPLLMHALAASHTADCACRVLRCWHMAARAWRSACRAPMRMWRETPIAGTPWLRLAPVSASPRTPGSRCPALATNLSHNMKKANCIAASVRG